MNASSRSEYKLLHYPELHVQVRDHNHEVEGQVLDEEVDNDEGRLHKIINRLNATCARWDQL